MSEVNDIIELPEGVFFLKITDKYQQNIPAWRLNIITVCTKMFLPVEEVIWILNL